MAEMNIPASQSIPSTSFEPIDLTNESVDATQRRRPSTLLPEAKRLKSIAKTERTQVTQLTISRARLVELDDVLVNRYTVVEMDNHFRDNHKMVMRHFINGADRKGDFDESQVKQAMRGRNKMNKPYTISLQNIYINEHFIAYIGRDTAHSTLEYCKAKNIRTTNARMHISKEGHVSYKHNVNQEATEL